MRRWETSEKHQLPLSWWLCKGSWIYWMTWAISLAPAWPSQGIFKWGHMHMIPPWEVTHELVRSSTLAQATGWRPHGISLHIGTPCPSFTSGKAWISIPFWGLWEETAPFLTEPNHHITMEQIYKKPNLKQPGLIVLLFKFLFNIFLFTSLW